jgi:hypothetical protein
MNDLRDAPRPAATVGHLTSKHQFSYALMYENDTEH